MQQKTSLPIPLDEFYGKIDDTIKNPKYEGEIPNPKTKDELHFNRVRYLCQHDLYRFAKYILPYSECYDPLHLPLCNRIVANTRIKKSFLELWPRGHFKTSLMTIAANVQTTLSNPDIGAADGHLLSPKSVKVFRVDQRYRYRKLSVVRDLR